MTCSALALLRLLQLASPTLPVGAFSYSQGLEAAAEAGVVHDAASAQRWIEHVLRFSVARLEAPVLRRLHAAWERSDLEEVAAWNEVFLASRETAELRAETLQMGYSLRRLVLDLGDVGVAREVSGGQDAGTAADDGGDASAGGAAALHDLGRLSDVCFPTAFAFAAVRWHLPVAEALLGYLWSWLENQVMAAIKAVPLGQTDGQRTLLYLGGLVPELARRGRDAADAELCNFTPGLAIASSHHEAQYSRLFRS